MVLHGVVTEIFNIKKCHDIEIRVRGHVKVIESGSI